VRIPPDDSLRLVHGWANYGHRAINGPFGFLIRPAELVHALTFEGVKGKELAYVLALRLGREWGGPDDVQVLLVPPDVRS